MATSEQVEDVEKRFAEYIREKGFPCLGAKSALATGNLRVIEARDITSAWNDVAIHDSLLEWSFAYKDDPEGLRSLAVVFDGPNDLSEKAFEAHLWERLQSLADKDHWRGQEYDERVSADAGSPHFSLSFGGEAFFVVGMHPGASRPARRFSRPVMVFNLHDQFERLREQGKYERMREVILDRDRQLAGDTNPMLSRHGEASEARQYSGRAVDPDWSPPFEDRRR